MSIIIKSKISGLKEVSSELEKISQQHKENLGHIIAGILEDSTLERFETSKSPNDNDWEKTHRGGKILDMNGYLKQSINSQYQDGSVFVGSNIKYAAIHQLGGVIKPKKSPFLRFKINGFWIKATKVVMPARPYLGISKNDEQNINLAINRFFSEAFQ